MFITRTYGRKAAKRGRVFVSNEGGSTFLSRYIWLFLCVLCKNAARDHSMWKTSANSDFSCSDDPSDGRETTSTAKYANVQMYFV